MIFTLSLIPLFAAGLLLLIPKENLKLMKQVVLGSCGFCFLITLSFLYRFEVGVSGYQFVEKIDWLAAFGIQYQDQKENEEK